MSNDASGRSVTSLLAEGGSDLLNKYLEEHPDQAERIQTEIRGLNLLASPPGSIQTEIRGLNLLANPPGSIQTEIRGLDLLASPPGSPTSHGQQAKELDASQHGFDPVFDPTPVVQVAAATPVQLQAGATIQSHCPSANPAARPRPLKV